MINVRVILASTREGRKGTAIAEWVMNEIRKNDKINSVLIDLASVNLPMLDEPFPASMNKYQHQHTKDWAAMIEPADAFVFVTAEYNAGYPASLKNALDYLYKEWNHKPVCFVSYGMVAGGTRSVQQLKQVVTSLKMVPLNDSVSIPFFNKMIDESGTFKAEDVQNNSAKKMFDELVRWTEAIRTLRQ